MPILKPSATLITPNVDGGQCNEQRNPFLMTICKRKKDGFLTIVSGTRLLMVPLGRMSMKSTRRKQVHPCRYSLLREYRSLIRSLRSAGLARAPPCAHLFACLLTRSLRCSRERQYCIRVDFIQIQATVQRLELECENCI